MTVQIHLKPALGSWLSSGSPVVTELAADSGFDWLLIDLEHGNGTEATIPDQLRAFRGSTTIPVVRVGAPEPSLIGRLLDWGAGAVMVPHVETPEDASACVRAMRYPPSGTRGVSRSVRAYGFGQKPFPGNDPKSAPLLIAQIETLKGVDQATAIARIEGVDVLFVGPADLQFDLNARTQAGTDLYVSCLQRVVQAASDAGKQAGILVRDPADLHKLKQMGFSWLAMDSDLGLLRNGYARMVDRWQEMLKTDSSSG